MINRLFSTVSNNITYNKSITNLVKVLYSNSFNKPNKSYEETIHEMQLDKFKTNFYFTNKIWDNKEELPTVIADVFNSHNNLKFLSISNLDDTGCSIIAESLKHHKDLEIISIVGIINKIGDNSCNVLAEAIRNNKNLKELNLSHNNITSIGSNKLISSVSQCPSFNKLILTNNNIDYNGANTIVNNMIYKYKFKKLCVKNNSMTEKEYGSLNLHNMVRNYNS